jgi:hypothetical protein
MDDTDATVYQPKAKVQQPQGQVRLPLFLGTKDLSASHATLL